MRIWERDARQRQLTSIYVPQEPRGLMPTEISDEIVLTHPAQPFTSSLDTMTHGGSTSAAGVNFIQSTVVPAGEVHWIHAFDAFHNDAVTRRLSIAMNQVQGNQLTMVAIDKASAQFQVLMSPRSLLLPAGYRLYAEVDIIGAGNLIFLRFEFVRYVAAEIPPSL